jgi:hypothetical protein
MDDYDYYDEKMLYLLNLFKEEREIKLANEKREATRNFINSFRRKTSTVKIFIWSRYRYHDAFS